MSIDAKLLAESAEDFLENAPCGYLSTTLDGTILKVNRTFESWTDLRREDLLGEKRFQDLLTGPGRIYHETHYSPLLRLQGSASEIALEIVRADGSRMPTLINSVVVGEAGAQVVRTTVFDATDRRRYEEELLKARRAEHEIALRLQRSLLSGAMPAGPGIEVGVRYRPAVQGLEVGGDWYDAFWLGERRVGLVVGDVVGRGIEAAASMGQLRSATRAFASTGLRPAALLEALDRYAVEHDVGVMATVVYAEVDLGTRRLRFACAGHPPPIVVPPGGEARILWDGRSRPLATLVEVGESRPEAADALPEDSTVLLYTDGLVEHRDRAIDVGLEALREQAQARRQETAADLTYGLVRDLPTREGRDDVCALAAAVT